jgi:hypothetical protein
MEKLSLYREFRENHSNQKSHNSSIDGIADNSRLPCHVLRPTDGILEPVFRTKDSAFFCQERTRFEDRAGKGISKKIWAG